MSQLALCSYEGGCNRHVQKDGHALCLEHWRLAQSSKAAEPEKRYGSKQDAGSRSSELLSSTELGDQFGLTAQQVNQVLSELGWITKQGKGWVTTEQGKKLCGEQKTAPAGVSYVRWPKALLTSNILKNSARQFLSNAEDADAENTAKSACDFRSRFPAQHRTFDGHWVRSKSEGLIDNWLYTNGIAHAYERRLPVEEEAYCDFFVPRGQVYLEYWGLENDPKYEERKKVKQDIYRKHGFNLIELTEKEVQNLDDHLPQLLLKFGVLTG